MKEAEVRGLIQRKILKWINRLKNNELTDDDELTVIFFSIWLLKDMED